MAQTQKKFLFIPFAALLFLIGMALYANTLNSPFQFDDNDFIVNNPLVKNAGLLKNAFLQPGRKTLTFLTFHLNYYLGKFDTLGYHLFNIVLHSLSAVLFMLVVNYILKTPACRGSMNEKWKPYFAFFSSLIFLCHPLETQAVTYIWQRSELLTGFFYLLAFLFYLHGRLNKRGVFYIGALLCFYAGFYSKESIVSLPILIFASEKILFNPGTGRPNRVKVLFYTFVFLLLGALLFRAHWSISALNLPFPLDIGEMYKYLITEFRVIVKYLSLVFVPFNQNLDYYFPYSSSFLDIPTLLSMLIVVGIVTTAVFLSRKHPLAAFGALWFFIYLIPTSTILPSPTVIFEHRLYLSIAGFGIFVNALMLSITRSGKIRAVLLSVFIIILSSLTISRNALWRSPVMLMEDTVRKSPLNPRPHLVLGSLYYKAGELKKAAYMLNRASELAPLYPDPYNNLGLVYLAEGNLNLAEMNFRKAIALKKDFVDPYINLAVLLVKEGRVDEAEQLLWDIRKTPDARYKDKVSLTLGNICFMKGNLADAEGFFLDALIINPDNGNAYFNLGNVYFTKGDTKRSIEYYEKALRIDPTFLDAKINIGVAYYKSGQLDKARNEFESALKIAPGSPKLHNNLAEVYFALNEPQKAEEQISLRNQILTGDNGTPGRN